LPRVRVDLPDASYAVEIGPRALAKLGPAARRAAPSRRVLLVSDANVYALYGARAVRHLRRSGLAVGVVGLPPGERTKRLATMAALYEAAAESGLDRGGAIVALGGGVVGDLAGFLAATYMRGVPVVQVPTTLLAQVDSSVGGKTGVDLDQGKNLVGAFHQPSAVLADTSTLATLPRREVACGAAELVKTAVLGDAKLFAAIEADVGKLLAAEPRTSARLVAHAVAIKARIVTADEREAGVRAHLNLGHTFGHAIESALGYRRLLHGEAVAIGMVLAGRLALRLGLFSERAAGRVEALLGRLGLPTRLPRGLRSDRIVARMVHDKKARAGRLRFVLPVRLGRVRVVERVSPRALRAVLRAAR